MLDGFPFFPYPHFTDEEMGGSEIRDSTNAFNIAKCSTLTHQVNRATDFSKEGPDTQLFNTQPARGHHKAHTPNVSLSLFYKDTKPLKGWLVCSELHVCSSKSKEPRPGISDSQDHSHFSIPSDNLGLKLNLCELMGAKLLVIGNTIQKDQTHRHN